MLSLTLEYADDCEVVFEHLDLGEGHCQVQG